MFYPWWTDAQLNHQKHAGVLLSWCAPHPFTKSYSISNSHSDNAAAAAVDDDDDDDVDGDYDADNNGACI